MDTTDCQENWKHIGIPFAVSHDNFKLPIVNVCSSLQTSFLIIEAILLKFNTNTEGKSS
jgi:hypothetical protein